MEKKNSWLMQVLQIPFWFAILWALVTYARPAVVAYSARISSDAGSADTAEVAPGEADIEAASNDSDVGPDMETKYVSTPKAEEDANIPDESPSISDDSPKSFTAPPRRRASSSPQTMKEGGDKQSAGSAASPAATSTPTKNTAASSSTLQQNNNDKATAAKETSPLIAAQQSTKDHPTDAVVINNPTKYTISFKVDGIVKTVKAGQSYQAELENRDSFRVSFDRGGRFGTSTRLIKSGSFQFGVTESGWQLIRVED